MSLQKPKAMQVASKRQCIAAGFTTDFLLEQCANCLHKQDTTDETKSKTLTVNATI